MTEPIEPVVLVAGQFEGIVVVHPVELLPEPDIVIEGTPDER